MAALVSIIIPVYNLENYIENCLNSIISQTYKNLEIICIDDGSADLSGDKIKAMAKKDDRIVYIRQDNKGVSVARNTGLDYAHGDYVMFVDGDDYLHFQAVEIFENSIEKSEYDIVCSYEQSTISTHEQMMNISSYNCETVDYKKLFSEVNGSVIGKSVWAKIIRRDFAVKVKFPVGISNGEDGHYIIRLLDKNAKVGLINLKLYYYFTRENSTVTSKFNSRKFSITLSFDDLCEHLKNSENSFLRSYSLQYLYQTIFYNRTMSVGTQDEEYIFSQCKIIGKKWLGVFLKDEGISTKIKLMFLVFLYSRHIYEFARMIKDPTMKDFYKSRKV